MLEVAKGLEDVELFDLVVREDDLGQVLAILQALQAPTQTVVRHIQLLQVKMLHVGVPVFILLKNNLV